MSAQIDNHMNDLAGAYVLDAVTPEEAELVEAHIAECEACRMEVEELRQVVDVLPLALDAVEPSAGMRDRLLREASADLAFEKWPYRQDVPSSSDSIVSFRTRAARVPRVQTAIGLVALAAVLALAIWNLSLQSQVHDQKTTVSALTTVTRLIASGARVSAFHPSATPSNRAVFVQPPDGSSAVVVAENLSAVPGKVYQLWLIKGSVPVSAGVFQVSGSGPQIWHVARSTRGFPTAAFTLEPGPNGSTRPTSAPILVTRLAG